MILSDPIPPPLSLREKLAGHIVCEIHDADISAPENAAGARPELASAVADFAIRRFGGAGSIDSEQLLIMTCRALWATGNEDAARSLLRNKGPELGMNETYADAIFADNLFSCLNGHSAFRRTLRREFSVLSQNGPYWKIDLRNFFSLLENGLELAVWRVLHALLGELSVLWDASSGRGALGLRNTRFVAEKILGLPRRPRETNETAREIIEYCEHNLGMEALERRWRFAPMAIDLG